MSAISTRDERTGAAARTAEGAAASAWTAQIDDAPVAVTAGGHGRERLVAVAGAGGLLTLLTPEGRPVGSAGVDAGLLTASWSADGMTLALGTPGGAWAWTRDTGLSRLATSGWCGVLAWHGADRLAVGDGRRAVVLETTRDGLRPAWATPDAASTVTTLAWLRDGREIAVGAYGGVRSFSRGRDVPARELPYAGSVLSTAVSPDGRWLVSGNQDASIHVWRMRDGEELEMAGFPRKVTVVTFDASGRWLAGNGATDSTVWDFGGKGPGGTAPRLLTHAPGGATALAWHPRLPVLASGGRDGSVAVWSAPGLPVGRPTGPSVSVPVSATAVAGLCWIDGGTLVAATQDGTVVALGLPVERVDRTTGGIP